MSGEEEDVLKDVLNRLVRVLETYVAELEKTEPGSKESARLSDSITKLRRGCEEL
jgi:hypothetical protein